jgi:hypothetical protein
MGGQFFVKVAYATHEARFSSCGRRVGEEGKTVMTFMIWNVSTVMTVNGAPKASIRMPPTFTTRSWKAPSNKVCDRRG